MGWVGTPILGIGCWPWRKPPIPWTDSSPLRSNSYSKSGPRPGVRTSRCPCGSLFCLQETSPDKTFRWAWWATARPKPMTTSSSYGQGNPRGTALRVAEARYGAPGPVGRRQGFVGGDSPRGIPLGLNPPWTDLRAF